MNWEEFLKPTKLKLGLFVLFLIVDVIVFVTGLFLEGIRIRTCNIDTAYTIFLRIMSNIITVFWGLPFYMMSNLSALSFIPSIIILGLFLIFFAIYWYVFACFITWLYDNRRGKKSKIVFICFILALIIISTIVMFQTNPPQFDSSVCYKQSLEYRRFANNCESLCKDAQSSGNADDAVKFCCAQMTGDTDFNRNGKVDAIDSESMKGFKVCENAIYCMNMFSCKNGTVEINPAKCLEILCTAWNNVYNNTDTATRKVKELIQGPGDCTLSPDENWFTYYGFDSLHC